MHEFISKTYQRLKPWHVYLLIGISSCCAIFIGLGVPNKVVFDEFYYSRFANDYCCTGVRFFDIHPPLAKLMNAIGPWLYGTTTYEAFQHINAEYPVTPAWAYRWPSALAASLAPILVAAILFKLKVTLWVALAAGLALVFENGRTIQGRVVDLDSYLVLGELLCLWLWLHVWQRQRYRLQVAWAMVAGIVMGLTVGTKLTGFVCIAMPFIAARLHTHLNADEQQVPPAWHWRAWSPALRLSIWAGLSMVTTYCLLWWLHFQLLPVPGRSDAFYTAAGGFWPELKTLHDAMLSTGAKISSDHPFASPWYLWPIGGGAIAYGTPVSGLRLAFAYNPALLWLLIFGNCLILRHIFKAWIKRRVTNAAPLFGWLLLLWFGAYAPLAILDRGMFVYSYLPPLMFSVLAVAIYLGHATSEPMTWPKKQWYKAALTAVLIVSGFVMTSPLTYGPMAAPWAKWWFGLFYVQN